MTRVIKPTGDEEVIVTVRQSEGTGVWHADIWVGAIVIRVSADSLDELLGDINDEVTGYFARKAART